MKKTSLIFAFGLFMSFGLTSCATTNTFKKDVNTHYFSKSKIVTFPIVSDLQIGAKKTMPSRLYTKTTVEGAKENILYDFMKEHNCDVVVEPMFSVEVIPRGMDSKLDVKIEMTGYIANYTNIRNFEPKDSSKFWLEKKTSIGNSNPNNNVASVQPTEKKKNANILLTSVLGVLGLVGLLLLL